MDRRTFSGAIVSCLLAAPLAVHAQPTAKTWRIGFLREGRAPFPAALFNALHGFGWSDGHNVKFEVRHAENADQLRPFAAELVGLKVDLIVTAGTLPTRVAKEATTTIPIVFSVGGDPVERGLVASMARPGGNLTGVALGLYDRKQLEVLKDALPGMSRVAYPVMADVNPPDLNPPTPGVQVMGITVQDVADFRPFFKAARSAAVDAVLIHDVSRLVPHLGHIGAEALTNRVPSIGFRRDFAEAGGLLSYAPVLFELQARVAAQINSILRGAKPAELPVEQPTRFELVINLKAAKALGVTIPQSLLLRADEVIK